MPRTAGEERVEELLLAGERVARLVRREELERPLGVGDGALATIARPVGWGFAWWGTVLYWVAGILYAVQMGRLLRERTR